MAATAAVYIGLFYTSFFYNRCHEGENSALRIKAFLKT